MTDASSAIENLLHLMACLRDPEHGCPWDLQQSFSSIAPHTLEECYEVIDAIESGDMAHLRNELGDLLFQVVFYARLGEEQGEFSFADIVAEISAKLLHRHPHVFPAGTLDSFGQTAAVSSTAVEANWERIKAEERASGGMAAVSALSDVPLALPAVQRARKLQKRAANVGFDWPDRRGVFAKVHEELAELEAASEEENSHHIEEELGDLMFSVINLSRHLRVEPETALRAANRKFETRFRRVEALAERDGHTLAELSMAQMEAYWVQVKAGG